MQSVVRHLALKLAVRNSLPFYIGLKWSHCLVQINISVAPIYVSCAYNGISDIHQHYFIIMTPSLVTIISKFLLLTQPLGPVEVSRFTWSYAWEQERCWYISDPEQQCKIVFSMSNKTPCFQQRFKPGGPFRPLFRKRKGLNKVMWISVSMLNSWLAATAKLIILRVK